MVAFVHGENPFAKNSRLITFQGDIYDEHSVKKAMHECELVVSTLGSWGTPKKDILSVGMSNIVPAMKGHNIQRIVSLTGHDARYENDRLSFVHRATHTLLLLFAPKILKDGEAHVKILAQSGLDWTVLRSPIMNEKGDKGYSLSNKRPMPWDTIHRQAVAQAICDQSIGGLHEKGAPFITRASGK